MPRDAKSQLHPRLLPVDLIFRHVPPFVANRFRTYALRAAGFRIGRTSAFWGMPTLIGSGDIASRLSIGEACGFNEGCFFDLEASITIHDHVSVGHDVMFLTGGHATGDATRRAGERTSAPIVIEPGAWICARATILPGVTVGAGAVVGASVVVAKDVPPNTLLIGTQKVSIAKWR